MSDTIESLRAERDARCKELRCAHCGGSSYVNSGAFTPWGSAIDVPCPACNKEWYDFVTIGAAWRQDSSLEKWFPITAEELNGLRAERDELRNRLGDAHRLHLALGEILPGGGSVSAQVIKLLEERDALRAALEEVCRCEECGGTGKGWILNVPEPVGCHWCNGTGRDYHGSEAAKKLLEGKS